MTPKAKEQRSAGELVEDSCTRRKRARRVSFAETTVHVFKPDEESESPADSTPVPGGACRISDNEDTVGFRGIRGDTAADFAPEDEEETGARLKFARDVDSVSPGSAVGSVTPNEDDNFFGPVLTSFMNSGRLSESGMSDDNNHDITLDSTAFSMHFKNVALLDDHSANSAGSLRTPTGDATPSMPVAFLVGRDQSEEIASKCSIAQISNVSGDSNMFSPIKGERRRSYDYGKLSLTLEELMDQINLKIQQDSLIDRAKTPIFQTDDARGMRQPGKDVEVVVNQKSCCDKPDHTIYCSVSPMGSPTRSNESLLQAKAETSTCQPSSEKIQEKFSSASIVMLGKGHAAFTNGENTKLLSPSHEEFQNELNRQACNVHQKLFESKTSDDKSCPDQPPHSISAVLSYDAEQKLDSVSIAHTPKNATNSFHFSSLEQKPPSSHGQAQHFSQTVPSSSKFLSIFAREKHALRSMSPDNAIKAFEFSSPKRAASSFLNKKHAGISVVELDAPGVNSVKQTELLDVVKELNYSGNITHLPKFDKTAALGSMDISMKTPNNVVKAFQFSTLQGSLSFQNKQRKPQYHSVMSQSESVQSSARELSASLKMELIEHEERISAIKTSITRSKLKSRMQTDCEATPSRKDLFLTSLHNSLNESIDDSYMKHAGISYTNANAEVNAAKQLQDLDVAKDLKCSRNDNYWLGLDKNLTFVETNEKGQSENRMELYQDSSRELNHNFDPCISSIQIQRVSDLKEPNQDISINYALSNNDNLSLSSDVCATSVVDNITFSRDLLEHKCLQPATYLSSPSIDKVRTGKDLNVPVNCDTLVQYEKTDIDPKSFHLGGLHTNKNLYDNSTIVPKKVKESPLIDSFKAPGEVLVANTTLSKSLKGSSYFHGSSSQTLESQNKQAFHPESNSCSESYRMHNSQVTIPVVIDDSVIQSADDVALDIAVKEPNKRWTDMFSNLSNLTDKLLPQSISELNLNKFDIMEDLLDKLQTARKYEGFCTALKNKNSFCDPYQKRVFDAKSLLEKLVFAKARKQLKCMKLKKLHDKAHILELKVEEFNKLKSIYTQMCDLSSKVVEQDESSNCKHLEEQDKLKAMKQELGTIEQNIKHFLKSFEVSCKFTEKLDCDDAIKIVDEHVKRKAICRAIQQRARLWKLSNLTTKNDHYEIILDYCNLLFQRFTLNKNRFSNVFVNVYSNAENITKKYPNMNACTAFEFIFKLNVDQKLANSNCICERTMETNLLMGTLTDVLEEIQLSQVELLNLIFSTFLKLSSGELELQLCFYSFCNHGKLVLGVDMTSLNCGVYPSDPAELKIRVCEQQTTIPESLGNEAIRAVRSLDCGHLTVLRLCRCVSQVVRGSS